MPTARFAGRSTRSGRQEDDPAWSPDGRRIAFSTGTVGNYSIRVARPDGTRERRLTRFGIQPCWSADGSRIAFVTGRDGDAEIYVMRADGGGVRKVTRNRISDTEPALAS